MGRANTFIFVRLVFPSTTSWSFMTHLKSTRRSAVTSREGVAVSAAEKAVGVRGEEELDPSDELEASYSSEVHPSTGDEAPRSFHRLSHHGQLSAMVHLSTNHHTKLRQGAMKHLTSAARSTAPPRAQSEAAPSTASDCQSVAGDLDQRHESDSQTLLHRHPPRQRYDA